MRVKTKTEYGMVRLFLNVDHRVNIRKFTSVFITVTKALLEYLA